MTSPDEGGISASRREELLAGIGATFSSLRRRNIPTSDDPPIRRKNMTRVLVLNVVDDDAGDVAIGDVATLLGIDPSVASRMVADCLKAGYIKRSPSEHDGRRTVLQLTNDGRALRETIRQEQRVVFEQITHTWSDDDRLQLAELITRYAHDAQQWQDKRN